MAPMPQQAMQAMMAAGMPSFLATGTGAPVTVGSAGVLRPTTATTGTTAPAPRATSAAPVSASDVTLSGAFTAAKQDGRPVVAIFTAPSWCSWCRKLEAETLSDSQVKDELKRFHVVKVDYDKETALVAQYGVNGVPHTIIFDSSGIKKGEIPGFEAAADFLLDIRAAAPAGATTAAPVGAPGTTPAALAPGTAGQPSGDAARPAVAALIVTYQVDVMTVVQQ